MPGIRVKGLMTSAPYVANPEDNRMYFRQLKQLCVDINAKNIDNINMDVLSMGMTNDYIVAIEEGATHIRVGTAIFGARDYPPTSSSSPKDSMLIEQSNGILQRIIIYREREYEFC